MRSLERIHAKLVALPDRGGYVDTLRQMQVAGIAGLSGRLDEARAGYRQVAQDLEELGVVLDQALVAIDMGAVLGPDDPAARAQADRARSILEGLGARPYLARLDSVMGGAPATAAPVPASVASEVGSEVP